MPKIARAILSCYDKTGLVDLAKLLQDFHVEMISTSGTLHVLRDAGIEAQSIEDFTGVQEMMDGRVKSLHAKVHAGLLGDRDSKLHVEQMQAFDMHWIDLVVVNLKPLEKLLANPGITTDEVFELTNIGGASLIRSAAKNFRYVSALMNPERYAGFMHELRVHEGEVSFTMRHRLAQDAFDYTAHYDQAIADYLRSTGPPVE